jgi:hypothetical protein
MKIEWQDLVAGAGVILCTVGAWRIYAPAGPIFLGICCIVLGIMTARNN